MTVAPPVDHALGLSHLAQGLVGSEILKVSREVSALCDAGREICNLTVGDFSPREFRIPAALEHEIVEALRRGETNYPPSDGVKEMRAAVVRLYDDAFGLKLSLDSTLIAGGARPIIFAAYSAVVDPGDKVIYSIPSWNNNHYTYLTRGVPVEIAVGPETNFLPTAEQLRPHVRDARMICICTPLNPTGTVMARDEVEAIGRLVVDENARRAAAGERTLFLMWDQVYWQLTFGEFRHYAPPQLVPESAPWTIFVDGVSQAFGLKQETGWFRLSAGAVSPDDIRNGLARVRKALETL